MTASNKASNKASNNNKSAPVAEKTVVVMGKTMTQADVEALMKRLAAADAAKLALEGEKAALESRVKTSSKREITVPNSLHLQPIFVTLRGEIGEQVVLDTDLIKAFNDTAKTFKISIDKALSEKLVNKTILHNSRSNINDKKKNSDKSACDNRIAAYKLMLKQARVLLPLLTDAFCNDTIKIVTDAACYK